MVVSTGSINWRDSKPPNVGYRYVNCHCWAMTWTGRTSCDVGVQIGLGPSPPPAPAGTMSSTVPKVNTPSTIAVVVAIQAIWTPR